MKLIVDIPNEDCAFYISMYKGTSLEEELEKIKTDFEKLANDEWNIQVGASKGLECAIDVIEDRITELKGETNE